MAGFSNGKELRAFDVYTLKLRRIALNKYI